MDGVYTMPSAGDALFGLLHVYKRTLRERYLQADISLTLSHVRVLKAIGRAEGVTPSEIATQLLQDKGLVTRVVRELEREVLIERCPHPTDSRAAHLHLTDKGRAMAARIDAIDAALDAQMTAGLENHQASAFIHTLNVMANHLEAPQENA